MYVILPLYVLHTFESVKNLLHISLLTLFLLPQVSNTFVWINYELNIEVITEAFCVNKAKPELKCNGKCHLAEQLSEPTGPVGNDPVESVFIPQLQLFFVFAEEAGATQERQALCTTNISNLYTFTPCTVIDQPPKSLA